MFLITVVLIKITSSLYFHDWADDLSSRVHLIHLNGISSVDQSSLSTKWPRQFSYSKTFQYPDSSNTTNLSLENEVNPSLIVFFITMFSCRRLKSFIQHCHTTIFYWLLFSVDLSQFSWHFFSPQATFYLLHAWFFDSTNFLYFHTFSFLLTWSL